MIEILENQLYVLRKINPDKWAGIRQYQFTQEGIGPGVDQQGLPETGLTEDKYTVDKQGRKIQVKGTRKIMEEKLGMTDGNLRKGSISGATMAPNQYWINFFVPVGDSDLILDSAIPEHELQLRMLVAQPQVAFGVNAIKAKSEFVIFTREEEAKQSNKRKRTIRKAYATFESMSTEDMKEVLELLGTKCDGLTIDVIEDKLSDKVEESPAKFLAVVDDPTRKHKTFIRQCLDRGVLHFEEGAVVYGETVLGYDIDSAATALFSDEHAKSREAIKLQITSK